MGELPHHHEDRKRLERLRSFIQEPESFQEVANLCRLLSDNSRVRIFWLLCHCEECVMNLSTLVGMSEPRRLPPSAAAEGQRPHRQPPGGEGRSTTGRRIRRWPSCCTRSSSARWR